MTAAQKGATTVAEPQKITRDDIEAKFRQLTADVDDRADAAKSTAVAVGAVVAAVVVVSVPAATSHSASVGRRAPRHRAKASTS